MGCEEEGGHLLSSGCLYWDKPFCLVSLMTHFQLKNINVFLLLITERPKSAPSSFSTTWGKTKYQLFSLFSPPCDIGSSSCFRGGTQHFDVHVFLGGPGAMCESGPRYLPSVPCGALHFWPWQLTHISPLASASLEGCEVVVLLKGYGAATSWQPALQKFCIHF